MAAQRAKESGNLAFKAYRLDPVYPLNRAAAYLKIGKNEDAERDCGTTLSLDPFNVKALFRRAQARAALGKILDAQQDLTEALRLEPNNYSIQRELGRVAELIAKQAARREGRILLPPHTPDPTKRRRVPITIVEPVTPAENHTLTPSIQSPAGRRLSRSDQEHLQPVSSRNLNSYPTLNPTESHLRAATIHSSTSDNALMPRQVVGGIVRPSGQHTIVFSGGKGETAGVPSEPEDIDTLPVTTPNSRDMVETSASKGPSMTLSNFTKAWYSKSTADDKWRFLSETPPYALPSLFQVSLEPSLLASLLETLLAVYDHADNSSTIKEYVLALAKVPRVRTIILLMSTAERQNLSQLRAKVGDAVI